MLYQSPMCRGQSLCGGAACAISGSSHARTQVTRHRASREPRAPPRDWSATYAASPSRCSSLIAARRACSSSISRPRAPPEAHVPWTCHGDASGASLKEAQPPRAPSACACAWRPASPPSPGPDRRAAPTYTSCGRVIGRSRTTQATGSACHLSSSSAALEMSFWTVTMPM